MKILKASLIPIFVTAVLYIAFATPFMGCKKTVTKTITDTVIKTINDTAYYDAVCPLRGSYSGTNTSSTGVSAPAYYTFQDNNLAVGKITVGGADVTFGSYKNTCDSVIISVYYTAYSSYYILKGKFSNNRNTISGSYNNLTTPSDYGTFVLAK